MTYQVLTDSVVYTRQYEALFISYMYTRTQKRILILLNVLRPPFCTLTHLNMESIHRYMYEPYI